jgi:uncharacterized protein
MRSGRAGARAAALGAAGSLGLLWGTLMSAGTPAPRWAEHDIVDAHGHLGSFRGYDLSTETLLANVERFGVRLVLVSNIDGAHLPGTTRDLDETAANEVTRETVARHPDRLRALAWTRPAQGGRAETIETYLRDHGFVGVKLHPEMNQFPADSPLVDPYLRLCERYGVAAVYHAGAEGSLSSAERIYAAARRFPRVAVVLYHMSFFGDPAPAVAAVKRSVELGDADLYLETAQAEPLAVLGAIRAVGAGRVLFGTDATYFGRDHYERYEPMIELLRSELSAAELGAVLRGNAERLFRLGPSRGSVGR